MSKSSTASRKNDVMVEPKEELARRNGQSLITRTADADDLLLQEEGGDTVIREHVVGKIAGLAIQEVPGVHELVPFGTGEAIEAIAKRVGGGVKRDLGVRVEIGRVECAIDCRIVARYGASIPEIAEEIRRNVRERVRQMTGLEVKEVNIEVTDLYFDDDRVTASESSARHLR